MFSGSSKSERTVFFILRERRYGSSPGLAVTTDSAEQELGLPGLTRSNWLVDWLKAWNP